MEYLKAALKAKKMTQRELGQRIGCGESTISQYVNGKRSPDYETLLRIAEELDCSVDYLLRGEESNPIIINNEAMHRLKFIFTSLPPEDQQTLVSVAEALHKKQEK